MRTRPKATIEDLRRAIDCLPHDTKVAMLDGIRSNEIIVGAYTGRDGICPMLAAHRSGGRTSLVAFAHAWDRFAFRGSRTSRARRGRRATRRELLILTTHLEASLLGDDMPSGEFSEAIAQHRELRRTHSRSGDRATHGRASEPESDSRRDQKQRPGDADRTRELRERPGWAWLRVVRRYDDYERALKRLQSERPTQSQSAHRPPEPVR